MDARPLRPEALLVELGVVVALWALVVGTIAAFDRVGRRAAALLVLYLVWGSVRRPQLPVLAPERARVAARNNIDLAVV